MKRKLLTLILLITGFGIIGYPHISNYLNQQNGTKTLDNYQQSVDQLSKEEKAKEWRKAEVYNENLTGQPAHDPFIPGSGIAMPQNYYKVLNIEGTMGKIEIPKIAVELPIYHGTSDKVLKKAVGHLEGSTMPVGGTGTHAVLTGHTGLTNARLFTDLTELKTGDQFYITVLEKTLAYQVDQITVIEPEQTGHLRTYKGKDYVTLMTCTPYGVNSHRLLVRGKRVPYQPSQKQKAQKVGLTEEQKILILTAVITSVLMLILILLTILRNRRSERLHK